MYQSTKTYGHEIGLSSAFRQWNTTSHCSKLHGYALAVKFIFSAEELDGKNWVVDFGSLKTLKCKLEDTFDHKLLVARDDPMIEKFLELRDLRIADVVVVDKIGCEAFAELVFCYAEIWLTDMGYSPRVTLVSTEVIEHGANSAIFKRSKE